MTFLDDESSVESSAPREGFEIALPSVTYRLASGTRNITIGGYLYTASPISRGAASVSSAGQSQPQALEVSLPVSHPICQRYLANGVPPRQILVTVRRQQGAIVEQIWCGRVISLAVNGHMASFLVPSRSGEAFKRYLPVITTSRTCPHILYDVNCKVNRAAFRLLATVASQDGRTVTLSTIGGHPNDWARWGELFHVKSAERMTVITQTGTLVTMQAPIFEMKDGDDVELYAGCSHEIATGCRDVFNNVPNFGGFPELPKINPFKQSGYGVIQQT